MHDTTIETPRFSVTTPDTESIHVFGSPRRYIHGSGTARRITCPAADGADRRGAFQCAVAEALSKTTAREGTESPILIGAIPFDTALPSSLAVPRQCRWQKRTEGTPSRTPFANGMRTARTRPDNGEHYRRAVNSAVSQIRAGSLAKVVLARKCDIECATAPDLDWLLARLTEQNVSGYPFRIPLADGRTLIGASPEQLIAKNGARISCTPLAGSARRTGNREADERAARNLLASTKDQHEHAFVVAHIRDLLAPHCRRLDVPETPTIMATPTMLHLASPISGDLIDPGQCVLQLACLLHPTPAVGGSPTRIARDRITALEGFDRDMFAGMVGWCDANGDGEWAVTIRCGTVEGRSVRLYAGAGIVRDSDPEAEWLETEAKLATMKQALGLIEAVQ